MNPSCLSSKEIATAPVTKRIAAAVTAPRIYSFTALGSQQERKYPRF